MDYLLFNNDVLISDGTNVRRIKKGDDPENILVSIQEVHLCVVDVDVLVAAAVENPIEKKDSILVRKFKELYQQEAYVIQDEKIDSNLFQVIGIKEEKVREVYSLLPSSKVISFIPYGIALRNILIKAKIDLNQTIVFVDEQGTERWLTVFDGLKFSRTRVITNNGEDILPEIKRSQIDFFKKNEEYLSKKSADLTIVANDQGLACEISKYEEKLNVACLNLICPALEGLKAINTQIDYRLPEEVLKKRKKIELRKNARTAVLSLCVVTAGFFYFSFNKFELGLMDKQYGLAWQADQVLNKKLTLLDRETYREDLKNHKLLNYGIAYLTVLNLVPADYEVESFKFIKSQHWDLEVSLSSDTGDIYDPIPKIKLLKNADIKDIFVNNQPGKRLRVAL